MGRHLGIDFSWILVDFEGQVGAMLGSKIDQNSIQEGIEKRMRKRKRLGGVLEAPGGGVDASRGGKKGQGALTGTGCRILSGPLKSFRRTRGR